MRKPPFTLLEILVAMALLSGIVALVGVNYARLSREERFLSATRSVAQAIQTAQQVSIIHKTDVSLNFSLEGKKLTILLETEAPRLPYAKENNSKKVVQGIEKIRYQKAEGTTEENAFSLHFSGAFLDPEEGVITMRGAGETKIVQLSGMPRPLRVEKEGAASLSQNASFLPYPDEVQQRVDAVKPKQE